MAQNRCLLQAYRSSVDETNWLKATESHVSDLRLAADELLDRARLHKAYEQTVGPLMTIAANQGFRADWTYPRNEDFRYATARKGYSVAADKQR